MADNEINVRITATDDGLRSALEQAIGAIGQLPSAAQSAEAATQGLSTGFAAVAEAARAGISDANQLAQYYENIGATTEAIGGATSATKAASEATSEFGQTLDAIGTIAAGVFGGLTIESAVRRIIDVFKEAIFGTAEFAESLEHLSIVTGSSISELQRMMGAADLIGVPLDNLGARVAQLNRRLAEMAEGGGSKAFRQALTDIGAQQGDVEDINNLLLKTSDYINEVGVSSRKAGEVVSELFGRGSATMQPFIASFRAASVEAANLGVQMPIEQTTEFQRALNVLKKQGVVALREIGTELAPLGLQMTKLAVEAMTAFKTAVDAMSGIGKYFATSLNEISKILGHVFEVFTGGGFAALGAIPAEWRSWNKQLADIVHGTTGTVTKDWDDAAKRIKTSMDFIEKAPFPAVKGTAPGSGGPIPGIGGPGLKPQQIFEQYRAELALEEAEYKNDADKKLAVVNDFVAKVRAIQNLPAKDLTEALAVQARAYDTFYAEKQRLALTDLANQESVSKALAALQETQAKGAFDQATAAIRNRLAAGQETKLQELADQRDLMNQTLALDLNLEAQRFANQKAVLDQQLAVVRSSKAATQEELNKAYTNEEVALAEHLNRMAALENKWAVDAGKNTVQATAETTKEMVTFWTDALDPISQGFDQMVTGVLEGTQSIAQAFKRMAADLALSMIRSGIKDFLVGGAAGSPGAAMFGTKGEAGGANVASMIEGTGVTTAVQDVLGKAFRGIQSVLTTVFGSAFKAVGSFIGGAASGTAAAAAQAQQITSTTANTTATGTNTGADVTNTGAVSANTTALGVNTAALGANTPAVAALTAAVAANTFALTSKAAIGGLGGAGDLGGMLGPLFGLGGASAVAGGGGLEGMLGLLPFLGFEHGGVVSAAGGMQVGRGGTFAILHPGEVVLPEKIGRRFTGGASDTGESVGQGGPSHTVNLHIHANDTKGFDDLLKARRPMLEKMIRDATR